MSPGKHGTSRIPCTKKYDGKRAMALVLIITQPHTYIVNPYVVDIHTYSSTLDEVTWQV